MHSHKFVGKSSALYPLLGGRLGILLIIIQVVAAGVIKQNQPRPLLGGLALALPGRLAPLLSARKSLRRSATFIRAGERSYIQRWQSRSRTICTCNRGSVPVDLDRSPTNTLRAPANTLNIICRATETGFGVSEGLFSKCRGGSMHRLGILC